MIYVIHARDGMILWAKGGENAILAALDYVTRRAAIVKAVAVRNGFAANAHEPLKIVEHSGRRLTPGNEITARKTRRTPDGNYSRTQRIWREVASPMPQAIDRAWRALQIRYPHLSER